MEALSSQILRQLQQQADHIPAVLRHLKESSSNIPEVLRHLQEASSSAFPAVAVTACAAVGASALAGVGYVAYNRARSRRERQQAREEAANMLKDHDIEDFDL